MLAAAWSRIRMCAWSVASRWCLERKARLLEVSRVDAGLRRHAHGQRHARRFWHEGGGAGRRRISQQDALSARSLRARKIRRATIRYEARFFRVEEMRRPSRREADSSAPGSACLRGNGRVAPLLKSFLPRRLLVEGMPALHLSLDFAAIAFQLRTRFGPGLTH